MSAPLFELMRARCGSSMGRPLRPPAADVVSHMLNRANARRMLFEDDGDSAACGRTMLPDTFSPHTNLGNS